MTKQRTPCMSHNGIDIFRNEYGDYSWGNEEITFETIYECIDDLEQFYRALEAQS